MKKKLTGILVCMLLFATASAVAGNLNIDENNPEKSTTNDVDWWPTFQHDFEHTGFSTSLVKDFLIPVWNYTTGNNVFSSPAIVDGKVYVGSQDSKLYCLNATSGDELWSYQAGGKINSHPTIVDGRVYFGTIYNKKAYCLDADPFDDGVDEGYNDPEGVDYDLIWKYEVDGHIQSSPVVADGRVYISASVGIIQPGRLYCLDAEGDGTGNTTEYWNRTFPFGGSISSPAVVDGKVYISEHYKAFYCLDADNGNELWNCSTIFATTIPTVANGRVFIGEAYNDNFYCLDADPSDGVDEGFDDPDGVGYDIIWSYYIGRGMKSPAIAYGNVYVGVSYDGVYCFNATGNGDGTTTLVWNNRVVGTVTSPAVADNKLYVGSWGVVYCLNAENGSIIWSYEIVGEEEDATSPPAVADGRVYIGSGDNNVYCFGPNNPPEAPDPPSGPTYGYVGIEYTYTTNEVTDPDGDDVFYMLYWGDGDNSGWLETPTASHAWDEDGIFNVKVKVKDPFNYQNESDSLEVTIVHLWLKEVTGGIGVSTIIKNVGDTDATDIDWSISFDGGIILWPPGGIKEGIIPSLAAGEEASVKTMVFGIGAVNITATVADGVDQRSVDSLVIGPFVLI